MKYRLAWEVTISSLEDGVNSLIAEGFEPLGGVSVAVYRNTEYGTQNVVFMQAMLNKEDSRNQHEQEAGQRP